MWHRLLDCYRVLSYWTGSNARTVYQNIEWKEEQTKLPGLARKLKKAMYEYIQRGEYETWKQKRYVWIYSAWNMRREAVTRDPTGRIVWCRGGTLSRHTNLKGMSHNTQWLLLFPTVKARVSRCSCWCNFIELTRVRTRLVFYYVRISRGEIRLSVALRPQKP